MTTKIEQSIRAITVTPEFFHELLADRMKEHPAERWVIVVGPRGSAEEMMDTLFMYGPAEEPLNT